MNKTSNILRWIATILTLLGALLTALNINPVNVFIFNAASIIWMAFAYRIKEPSLMVTNAGILAIYMFGTFKAIL